MAKCPEFWVKVRQYGEACGLCDERLAMKYIELVDEIVEKYKVETDRVYLNFSYTASKPINKFKPGHPIRNEVLKHIAIHSKNNERVTQRHVKYWLYDSGVPLKTDIIEPGKIAKKVMVDPKILQNGDLKSKLSALKSALTPGQIQILNDIMTKYNHDDEIGAISLALIWAKERMDNE